MFKPSHEKYGVEPSGKTHVVGALWTLLKGLKDGESVDLCDFEKSNFEKIKEIALQKINSKGTESGTSRKSRPSPPASEDGDSVASGGGSKRVAFKKEDFKVFHTTKDMNVLIRFLEKQGEGSAGQLRCIQLFQEKYQEIKKVSKVMDSGVSEDGSESFCNLIITMLGFIRKDMLSLKWNTGSAIVKFLDKLIGEIKSLKSKKASGAAAEE